VEITPPSEFLISVISSIVGAAFVFLAQFLYRFINERYAPFTGLWENHIYNEKGEIIKRDLIKVKQRGEILHGVISRFEPEDQIHRQWKMIGRIRGQDFFAIFWSIDPGVYSYGSWYVRQRGDYHFEGYYLKFVEEEEKYGIKPIRLDFNKSTK